MTVRSTSPFQLRAWYHLAGVYDGDTLRLYIDGQPIAEGAAEGDAIDYPPKGKYVVGGYEDANERNTLQGAIHEVRVYRRALTSEEIAAQFRQMRDAFPQPDAASDAGSRFARVARGPILEFTEPGTAVIKYQTHDAVATQ